MLLLGLYSLLYSFNEKKLGRGVGTPVKGQEDLNTHGEEVCPVNASKWWKDLVYLDKRGEEVWFNEEVQRCVGNGANTSFWKVPWRGEVPFKVKYSRLFSISTHQEATVEAMWMGNTNGGRWSFTWRRCLFVWEETLLTNLLGDLDGFLRNNVEDKWRWKLGDEGGYTVKSMYVKLDRRELAEGTNTEEEKRVFRLIWKVGVPSKVTAFVWKALLDRIPTRMNLEIRHCLPPDIGSNCVSCVSEPEHTSHIFLHCDMARNIWMKLMSWLYLNFIMPLNLFIHWECWSGGGTNKKIRKGLRMIWQAAIWVIWKARNDCIFKVAVTRWDEVVDEIKVLSWKWS